MYNNVERSMSPMHKNCAEAYFLRASKADIGNLLYVDVLLTLSVLPGQATTKARGFTEGLLR